MRDVQIGKDLLSSFSRYLSGATVNPFKDEIYICCNIAELPFYLRIKARFDDEIGRDLSDNFCHSYISVGGFRTFNNKPNKSIESLELPLGSRLISNCVLTGFLVSEDIPQIVRSGRVITREEYEAARSKGHTYATKLRP